MTCSTTGTASTPSRFSVFIDGQPKCAEPLPLAHTTDALAFRNIVEAGGFKPTHCDVFKEDLLYFFYGRPAYRVHPKRGPTDVNALNPVCFILDRASISSPKRIMPFDSGALKHDLYTQHLHPKMGLKDFSLGSNYNTVDRLVETFFGGRLAYLRGKALPTVAIPAMEFEAQSYYSVITAKGETPFDDRRSCVEVQVDHHLALTTLKVLAVVLPAALLDDPAVQHLITVDLGAEAIEYETFIAQPAHDTSVVIHEVLKFYKSRKWI